MINDTWVVISLIEPLSQSYSAYLYSECIIMCWAKSVCSLRPSDDRDKRSSLFLYFDWSAVKILGSDWLKRGGTRQGPGER